MAEYHVLIMIMIFALAKMEKLGYGHENPRTLISSPKAIVIATGYYFWETKATSYILSCYSGESHKSVYSSCPISNNITMDKQGILWHIIAVTFSLVELIKHSILYLQSS